MLTEHKSFSNVKLEVKQDDGAYTIQGYGATFGNLDNVGDIILPGAFTESLQKRMPKMLYQHETDDLIGVWSSAVEDSIGLNLQGKFANVQCGIEARELALIGALDSMSIGYTVVESEYNKEGQRLLKKLDLWEVSLVTFPANEMAKITGVKNNMNQRDFEKFLRDEGKYSHAEAKIIASTGYKALMKHRDGAEETLNIEAELASLFNKFTQTIKG